MFIIETSKKTIKKNSLTLKNLNNLEMSGCRTKRKTKHILKHFFSVYNEWIYLIVAPIDEIYFS